MVGKRHPGRMYIFYPYSLLFCLFCIYFPFFLNLFLSLFHFPYFFPKLPLISVIPLSFLHAVRPCKIPDKAEKASKKFEYKTFDGRFTQTDRI